MTSSNSARRQRGRLLIAAACIAVLVTSCAASAWFPWGFAPGVPV